MDTATNTEVTDLLTTFNAEPRKYDFRTAEGKFFKGLLSYTDEYEVLTGTVLVDESRGWGETLKTVTVPKDAIRLVRTVNLTDELAGVYLKSKLVNDWQARDKGKASLSIVDTALFVENGYGGGDWRHVAFTVWTLEKDGEVVKTERVVLDYHKGARVISVSLGNMVNEVSASILSWTESQKKQDEFNARVAEVKASFVPSYQYERSRDRAQKFVAKGVEASKGNHDLWHNHVHVAIETEVLNLCEAFLQILGKTNAEVTVFGGVPRVGVNSTDDIVVVDETIAFATVVARRVSRSWSSNDFASALIGQVLNRFTEVLDARVY